MGTITLLKGKVDSSQRNHFNLVWGVAKDSIEIEIISPLIVIQITWEEVQTSLHNFKSDVLTVQTGTLT